MRGPDRVSRDVRIPRTTTLRTKKYGSPRIPDASKKPTGSAANAGAK